VTTAHPVVRTPPDPKGLASLPKRLTIKIPLNCKFNKTRRIPHSAMECNPLPKARLRPTRPSIFPSKRSSATVEETRTAAEYVSSRQCRQCAQIFGRALEALRHEETSESCGYLGRIICPICDEGVSRRRDAVARHMRRWHGHSLRKALKVAAEAPRVV
jgi:uncharacterized C2H2 Zn-finger protein